MYSGMSNTDLDLDLDTLLALDPDFAAVCDARRDAWIDALDADAAAADEVA